MPNQFPDWLRSMSGDVTLSPIEKADREILTGGYDNEEVCRRSICRISSLPLVNRRKLPDCLSGRVPYI
jgi:hypothetical protein